MTRTAVIVQARMNSSRLPGKVMRRIAGRTILDFVLARCRAIPDAEVIVCAMPEGADSDPIAAEATRLGAVVFRGSEEDVLSRYLGAAEAVEADVILRVTSDCPLVDPAVCGAVLRLRADKGVDYACNNMPPSWPHGLDCEAFTLTALRRADAQARDPLEREHPTRIMRSDAGWSRVNLLGPGGEWENIRLTLDTPDDMALFEALLPRLADVDRADLSGIRAVLQSDRRLAGLTAGQELHHGTRREAPGVAYTAFLPSL